MRVTQSMMSSNMLSNLQASLGRLDKLNTQVSTQKKITKPSDDPVVAMQGMTYRRNLAEVEQFQSNFNEAYNWVENSDTALDKAKLALDRVRELVVQTANDTYDSEQRQAAQAEIEQLKEHLIEIANTKFGDKYLFNGTDTINAPVTENTDPANPNPIVNNNQGEVIIELSPGVHVPVNVSQKSAFSDGTTDVFSVVEDVIDKLGDPGTSATELSGLLGKLDSQISANTTARAQIGARFNRIELMEERMSEQKVISSRIMSENEDVDFEQVVTELTVQETIHKAALSVGSRIIQPTLMDFLR